MVDIPRTFDPWGEDRKYREEKAKRSIVTEMPQEIDVSSMVSIPDMPIPAPTPSEEQQ